MKRIPLTRGLFAIIDDEDFAIISLFKWYALKQKQYYYAATVVYTGNERIHLPMHRLLANVPKGDFTDHRNGDTLDNRKHNIRKCTPLQNAHNRAPSRGGRSKYKGVALNKGRWVARISVNGIQINLGSFSTQKAAAKTYDEAAIKYHKDFAHINRI